MEPKNYFQEEQRKKKIKKIGGGAKAPARPPTFRP